MKQKPDDDHKANRPGKKPQDDTKKKPAFAKQKDIEAAFGGKPGAGKSKSFDVDHKGPGALGAKAFAMGEAIAFKNETPGSRLIAHELTHVVQQSGEGKHDLPQKSGDGDDIVSDELLLQLGVDAGTIPDEIRRNLTQNDLKNPDQLLKKLEKKDAGKPIDLPFSHDLEAAFKTDLSTLEPFVAPDALGMVGADAFAVGSILAFGEAPGMEIAAEEAIHAIQQGGAKDELKEPEYLKHPDAKEDDKPEDGKDGKPKGSAAARSKPKLPADSQGELQVPLEAELLHALSERMSQKIERDVKSENDATGTILAR